VLTVTIINIVVTIVSVNDVIIIITIIITVIITIIITVNTLLLLLCCEYEIHTGMLCLLLM
jgi:hypothetical protein